MKVIDIRPPVRMNDLAVFDVEIGHHLRLYNLSLRRTPSGRLRTLAPNACGKHSASFHPELAEQLTKAAEAAMGGLAAYDKNRSAA
ncbi:hypothetical protein CN135_11035 [Sinorhizobium meliloti]|uniref:hypothetical protein n=1 Tax=Rhizobium meliloti TaxID=382 RepID=UPI000FD81D3B|nr:hypothetical protein [Sinorhizobium meliloti]MDX0105491.1 hypothetical protein [Sinorhizobium meliloti]RVL80582.1 hypothetical protein CN135_11035 [Sinorhizobium meliloti]